MNGQQKGGANQDIFITFLDLNIVSNAVVASTLLLCCSVKAFQIGSSMTFVASLLAYSS